MMTALSRTGREVGAVAVFHCGPDFVSRFRRAEDGCALTGLDDNAGNRSRARRFCFGAKPRVLLVAGCGRIPGALVSRSVGVRRALLPFAGPFVDLCEAAYEQQCQRSEWPHLNHVTIGRQASQGGVCA
jgi:hypothetical protein